MSIVNFTQPLVNDALIHIRDFYSFANENSIIPFQLTSNDGSDVHSCLKIFSSTYSATTFNNSTVSSMLIRYLWGGETSNTNIISQGIFVNLPGTAPVSIVGNTFSYGDTPWVKAYANGIAQSFVLHTFYWDSSGFVTEDGENDPNVDKAISGTVGLPGSGADLILSDTNIVAGQLYKVLKMNFNFPLTHTW